MFTRKRGRMLYRLSNENFNDMINIIVKKITTHINLEKGSFNVGTVSFYDEIGNSNTVVIKLEEDSRLTRGAKLHLYRYHDFNLNGKNERMKEIKNERKVKKT